METFLNFCYQSSQPQLFSIKGRLLLRKKFITPVWVNFSLLALLLVSSSTTLTACQNMRFGPEAIKKEKEDKAVKADKKKNENPSTKSKSNKSNPTPGEQDTQIDDDPQ